MGVVLQPAFQARDHGGHFAHGMLLWIGCGGLLGRRAGGRDRVARRSRSEFGMPHQGIKRSRANRDHRDQTQRHPRHGARRQRPRHGLSFAIFRQNAALDLGAQCVSLGLGDQVARLLSIDLGQLTLENVQSLRTTRALLITAHQWHGQPGRGQRDHYRQNNPERHAASSFSKRSSRACSSTVKADGAAP